MYKWINNTISEVNEAAFNQRAAKYGDGFFETIAAVENDLFLFDLHYERIVKSFCCLYFNMNTLPEKAVLKEFLLSALRKNGYPNSRISLLFQRDAEGYYTPTSNDAVFSVEVTPIILIDGEHPKFTIGIYTENKKPSNPISSVKTSNALIYVLAAAWKQLAGVDDAILLNQEGNLCEATSSNLFIIKDKKIYTPPLRDAPVDGIMRRYVIESLAAKNRIVIEKTLTDKELFDADEVFLTNTISRIRSVTGFGETISYGSELTNKLRIENG